MKKQGSNRFATALILHSSFFLLHFPGGTVATVGFPDIGLQGFKKTNDEGRMKNEETKPHPIRAQLAFLHSSFFLLHFPVLAKGEIASLSGAGDDKSK